jgi:hypothetical protein
VNNDDDDDYDDRCDNNDDDAIAFSKSAFHSGGWAPVAILGDLFRQSNRRNRYFSFGKVGGGAYPEAMCNLYLILKSMLRKSYQNLQAVI